jgi:spore maturation protein CgeB
MKVLFVAALHDEGNPAHGPSYECYNLYEPLQRVVDEVVAFDFMEVMGRHGRESMNSLLLETAERERPDLVIVAPFTDQLDFSVFDAIRKTVPVAGYFFDDVWRVEFTRAWSSHLTFATTSDVNGVERFRDLGVENMFYSPFGVNTAKFHPIEAAAPEYDVAFIGRYHPNRAWLVRQLQRAGISVHVRGTGWSHGRVTHQDMVGVFNRSRVNLNLSNAVGWDVRYIVDWRRPLKETLRVWRGAWRALRESDMKTREMVKGRHFEINACRAFQLTFQVEGLERHYQIGEELAVFSCLEDLIEKIRHFLRHDDRRHRIADAGFRRTVADHTMERRLAAIVQHATIAKGG